MRQLADDMKNAKVILAQINMMHEVSSQTVLLDIVECLQHYLQKRWGRRALEIKNNKGVYPTYDDLTQFLVTAARDLSDPVYGYTYMKKDKVPNKHVSHTATVQGAGSEQSGDITSVSASTQQQFTRGDRAYVRQEAPCVLCSVRHRLWHCERFKRMSPQERLKIVNDHKLS